MRLRSTFRDVTHNPVLIAAMVLSVGLIVFLAGPRNQTGNRAAEISSSPKPVRVLVASHALAAGSEIGLDDVSVKFVSGPVPAGAATSEADIVGRITAKQYAAKEMFSRPSLLDVSSLGIAARLRPGRRAFSVRIAEDDIVGGFLQSGDHVDAFATIPGSVFPSKSASDVPDRSQTVLLLQNVLVLAVGENPATRGSIQSSARTVSLELTPDGLARLALAERYGKVSLAIRKPGDDSMAQSVSAALTDLIPLPAHVSSTSVAPAPPSSPSKHHRTFGGIPFYSGTRSGSLSFAGSQ